MGKIISYNDKIIVEEWDKDFGESICHHTLHYQVKSLLIVLTTKGYLKLSIGYQDYLLEKQILFTLLPIRPLQIVEVSPDYKGTVIKISYEFLANNSEDKGFYTMNNMFRRHEDPCIYITIEEKYTLLKKIAEIKNRIKNSEHIFYRAIIGNTLEGFMLDVNNLIMQRLQGLINSPLSRKNEIVNNFLELLSRFCIKEHNVLFFAKKLCISSKYLSLVIKAQTGKTANQWISDILISESVLLLKIPNITIKEVSYKLCFSDQSSFGKFFKKHMLISPLMYRKDMVSPNMQKREYRRGCFKS